MKKIFFCLEFLVLSLSLCACGKKNNSAVIQSPNVSVEEMDSEILRDPSEVINEAREVASYFCFDNHNPNYYDESIAITPMGDKISSYMNSPEVNADESPEVTNSQISEELSSSPVGSETEMVTGETTETESPEAEKDSESESKTEESPEPEDNRKWCKVVDVRFNTPEAAKKFLQTQFSSSLTEKIYSQALKNEFFKELDGSLFALVGDGGRLIDSVDYTIKSKTKNKVVYKAVVKYLADEDSDGNPQYETKEYTFIREKINGEWIFTKFEYVW